MDIIDVFIEAEGTDLRKLSYMLGKLFNLLDLIDLRRRNIL